MRDRDLRRGDSPIDASLSCLVGDGAHAKDVLFKIKIGEIKRGGGSQGRSSRSSLFGLEGG